MKLQLNNEILAYAPELLNIEDVKSACTVRVLVDAIRVSWHLSHHLRVLRLESDIVVLTNINLSEAAVVELRNVDLLLSKETASEQALSLQALS